MVTKWAIPRIENFNDMPKFLNKQYSIFKSVASTQGERPYSCGFTMSVKNPSESIWIHSILVHLLNSDNWSLTLPFEQLVQLVVEYRVPHKRSTEMDAGAKSVFEEGKTYYERNKDLLTHKYNGEYITIWDNEVLDHDTSFSALAQRVYKKLGYVSIYMPFVTSKRRVLRFESPRIRR